MMPPYTLNTRKNLKNLRITITRTGEIILSKPNRIPLLIAENFILSKSDWINSQLEKIKSAPQQTPHIKLTKKDYLRLKPLALKLTTEKLALYNRHYNLPYKNITIKNTKTRWGSCSHRGNLNFNYKIALIPEQLQNYIVVHELCHRGQFNHSQKFWDLVAETIPNHLELRRELRKIHL